MVAGPEHLFEAARAWYAVLALELIAVMAIHVWVTRRRWQHSRHFSAVTLLLLVGAAVVLIEETAVQWEWVRPAAASPATIFAPVFLAALGTSLFFVFARACAASPRIAPVSAKN